MLSKVSQATGGRLAAVTTHSGGPAEGKEVPSKSRNNVARRQWCQAGPHALGVTDRV